MAKKKSNVNKADDTKVNKADVKKADETVKNDGVKAPEVKKFSKKQFVTSHKFAKRKDLVNALLEDGKSYSIKEVEDIIHNFLYGKK